jgi:hypothetical protein
MPWHCASSPAGSIPARVAGRSPSTCRRTCPGNVVAVFDAMLRAMAAGEITPEEARAITLVLDARNRVLEAWQRERSLAEHERFAAGGILYPKVPVFDWHPDDDENVPEPPGFAAAWRRHEAEWAEYEANAPRSRPGRRRLHLQITCIRRAGRLPRPATARRARAPPTPAITCIPPYFQVPGGGCPVQRDWLSTYCHSANLNRYGRA